MLASKKPGAPATKRRTSGRGLHAFGKWKPLPVQWRSCSSNDSQQGTRRIGPKRRTSGRGLHALGKWKPLPVRWRSCSSSDGQQSTGRIGPKRRTSGRGLHALGGCRGYIILQLGWAPGAAAPALYAHPWAPARGSWRSLHGPTDTDMLFERCRHGSHLGPPPDGQLKKRGSCFFALGRAPCFMQKRKQH